MNFEDLLEQARQGAPRTIFRPHMEAIADPKGFDNPTQLRLLGNAIANSPENANVLMQKPAAIEKLLYTENPIGLQVLYNGTVSNREFSQHVLNILQTSNQRVTPSTPMKNLLGSIWESCSSEIKREFVIQLVIDGFVELLVLDPSLETESQIISNFKTIYNHCQQISINAEDSDEFDSLGFRVVGNITSHREFTIKQAEQIEETPFTWETVILLANLSSAKKDVAEVLTKWPNLVENTIKLIEAEDPEEDNLEQEEEEEDEEEEDEEQEPPFDLELWGGLLRNVSRHPIAAQQIAKYHPAKLFTRLLTSPNTQEVAGDFAVAFASNCYDHSLTEIVTAEPYNGGSVLVTSSIVQGMTINELDQEELDWAVPKLTNALIEGMLADEKEGVWIKGSKALALLKTKYGVSIDITKLKSANLSNEVKQNLAVFDVN